MKETDRKKGLSGEEAALWNKVAETIAPLDRGGKARGDDPRSRQRLRDIDYVAPQPDRKAVRGLGDTLDGGWDRRIKRGAVEPDRTIDLHGHSLDAAWDVLDRGLDRAIAGDARVILLITGKPPKDMPATRGKIRGAVGAWLESSRHAEHIAAVRDAHPRHGGRGALYIVLRRRR